MNRFLSVLSVLSGALVFAVFFAGTASASITINIFAGQLRNTDAAHGGNGSLLVPGTLIQLINLGPDGIFNSVSEGDPLEPGLARWVSGDDTLVNLPFGSPDFASAAAFDYNVGPDGSAGAGVMDRVFTFATGALPAGTKLGIRWFPGMMAADFENLTNSASFPICPIYGQFTRLASPQFGESLWVAPADGANVTFDPLATQSMGGADPNSAGNANFGQLCPEPASVALLLIGTAGLAAQRRRRA